MTDKKTETYAERQKEAKARYIAEKTDRITAYLPRGYGAKVQKIADAAGCSKAQALRSAIDMLYAAVCGKE